MAELAPELPDWALEIPSAVAEMGLGGWEPSP
jgi:hypothetical protein